MTDHKYVRSEKNPGAVINTDRSALDGYRARKLQAERINTLEDKVDNIEGLLKAILSKLNKED
jgi:hypothetical protein